MERKKKRTRWFGKTAAAGFIVGMAGLLVLTLLGCGGADEERGQAKADKNGVIQLDMARFFGEPADDVMDSTDLADATSEAAAIQILTNIFNEENKGKIQVVKLGGSEWGSYYDQMNTTFAAKNPPDVAVMHQTNMPAYASRGLLIDLDSRFSAAGIDSSDWTRPAAEAIAYKGKSYGVPFDLHGNLIHVNVDLFKKAGLTDANGVPILPTSVEEFFQHAEIMKQKTGKLYWVEDATQYPINFRLFHSLMEQQGVSIINEDGSNNMDSPEARKALGFMLERFEQGYANPLADYTAAQKQFMNGEAAIELNGTWVVDQYNRELDFEYRAMNFPNLMGQKKVWANSHIWVIPKQQKNPEKYEAALEFLKFLNDHVYDWAAGTGHIAPRKSILAKLSADKVPQRENYAETAENAVTFPSVLSYSNIETIIYEELQKTWLLDEDVDTVLKRAASRIDSVMNQ